MASFIITSVLLGESYQHKADSSIVVDLNIVSPTAFSSNTVFEYTGRHDHGNLLPLKSTGSIALLLTSLLSAKSDCDRYLTQRINEEYGYTNQGGVCNDEEEDDENRPKKSKREVVSASNAWYKRQQFVNIL